MTHPIDTERAELLSQRFEYLIGLLLVVVISITILLSLGKLLLAFFEQFDSMINSFEATGDELKSTRS